MSVTYLQVLDAARDYSSYFAPTYMPGGSAIRFAMDIQRELAAKAIRRDPSILTTSVTFTPIASVIGVATALPAFSAVQYGELNYSDPNSDPQRIDLIADVRKGDFRHDASMYLQGRQLYVTGTAADWATVASLTVYYTPLLPDLAAETDLITLPDSCRQAFSAKLAASFAMSVNGTPTNGKSAADGMIQLPLQLYMQLAAEAEKNWLSEIAHQRQRNRAYINADDAAFPRIRRATT